MVVAEGVAAGKHEADRQGVALSASEWAAQQWIRVNLGDKRRNRRALEMGAKMAARPEASLPCQQESRKALRGAYRILNNSAVTMEALLAPHLAQTRAAATRMKVVLFVEDTTELDYTAYYGKVGLGPIGNGRGRGLLLHSTLGVEPETRQILGVAHAQAFLREPSLPPQAGRRDSPESRVWEESAEQVGAAPAGVTWVHIGDAASDIFEYMTLCLHKGKEFLLRAKSNRRLVEATETTEATSEPEEASARYLLDSVRGLPALAGSGYSVSVPRHGDQPARQAQVVLAWSQVKVLPPKDLPIEVRRRGALTLWVLRVWEESPPLGVDGLEWVLLSSLPIDCLADARRAVDWYSCRWLCEDFHQCLKTGCRVEHSQLDDGADLQRLLGFAIPLAIRLLQLRQSARQIPEQQASTVVDPLMVEVLARREKLDGKRMTARQFWQEIARLGGHQGRRRDGPPGWQTIWKGWRLLADLTEGARLFANNPGHGRSE